jgi:cytochrome c-type biogenesis protein CcmH
MTLFWIVSGLLTAGVVLLLVRPLIRKAGPQDEGGGDLAVYRDQLAELERERARGLVEPGEAASLEAEIGRRMLGAARSVAKPAPQSQPARRLTLVLTILMPLAGLALYIAVGHPELPAQPLASRTISPNSDPAKILAQVESVKAKLKPTRDDLDQWVMIAEAYTKLGRPRDAVEAFRTASTIAPEDSALSAALAEALIGADGGAVGEEAKTILRGVPDDSPAKPEARYYLALADYQAGDYKAALAGWQGLLAASHADDAWIDSTRSRIAAAATALGLDPAKETPTPLPPAPKPADDIARMTPEQQQAMIQGMVTNLAAKLEANPDNPTGWRQLARAYTVLGQEDKAKQAMERAAQAEAKAKP